MHPAQRLSCNCSSVSVSCVSTYFPSQQRFEFFISFAYLLHCLMHVGLFPHFVFGSPICLPGLVFIAGHQHFWRFLVLGHLCCKVLYFQNFFWGAFPYLFSVSFSHTRIGEWIWMSLLKDIPLVQCIYSSFSCLNFIHAFTNVL